MVCDIALPSSGYNYCTTLREKQDLRAKNIHTVCDKHNSLGNPLILSI